MPNKQYNDYNTSELCTGYGTGISCVACCCDTGAPCGPWLEKNLLAIGPNVRINGSAPDNYLPQTVFDLVKPTFKQCLKQFNEMIEKNTNSFEAKIKKGLKLEEIARTLENFFGKVNGKIGCMIYPKDSLQKDNRLSMCRWYLCDLAKFYKGDEISEFVKENEDKLDTLSYSRMIYAINYNEGWLNDRLGIDLNFRKERHKCVSDLSRLLEIVKI